jgi:hypothetical protein
VKAGIVCDAHGVHAGRTVVLGRSVKLMLAVSATALLALGGAIPAGGSPTAVGDPELEVSSTTGGGRSLTSISLGVSSFSSDQPPAHSARVELSPAEGYRVDLTRPVGTDVGVLFAELLDLGGTSPISASGAIVVDDPLKYVTDPTAQACAPGTHGAVWIVALRVLGQELRLPVFLDSTVGTAGPRYTLLFCPLWSPPTVSQNGIGAIQVAMLVDGLMTPPTARGFHTWSAIVTPPAVGSTIPDPSRAAEVRATFPLPQRLTLSARYDAKTKSAQLKGAFTVLGKPRAGVGVRFVASALGSDDVSFFGPVRTDKSGGFSIRRSVERSTRFSASVPSQTRACAGTSTAPRGCLSETMTPPDSASTSVILRRVTDPKRAIKKQDQVAARRANLQRSDIPSNWDSQPAQDVGAPLCEKFAPNLSRLTITGSAASPIFFSETGGAWSEAWVYLTEAQGREAFSWLAQRALATCRAKELPQELDARVSSVSFPKMADATRAFRISGQLEGRTIVIDLVWLRAGRTVVLLNFGSDEAPLVNERELAAKVAARARKG